MNKEIAVMFLISLIKACEGQIEIEVKEAENEDIDDQV